MNPRDFISRYLATTTASISDIRPVIWNQCDSESGVGSQEKYIAVILEQYKVCLEMADRVSARRGLANTFFLTLNTLVVAAAGTLTGKSSSTTTWLLVFPFAGLMVQCAAWFWLIRSYRQLNSAKYVVIGALEERLPASPYWKGEWTALGQGRVPSRYWPLSHLEQWIPVSFAIIYVAGLVAAFIA